MILRTFIRSDSESLKTLFRIKKPDSLDTAFNYVLEKKTSIIH